MLCRNDIVEYVVRGEMEERRIEDFSREVGLYEKMLRHQDITRNWMKVC